MIYVIIISTLSLVISAIIFFRDYLLHAKIEAFLGDSIQISCKERGKEKEKKIILSFSFVNTRNRLGVVNYLKLEIETPSGNMQEFDWKIFSKWDGMNSSPDGLPRPLPVLAKSSIFQIISFTSEDDFSWDQGVYTLTIHGWYNKYPYKGQNNINRTIGFFLKKDDVNEINQFLTTENGNIKTRRIKIYSVMRDV